MKVNCRLNWANSLLPFVKINCVILVVIIVLILVKFLIHVLVGWVTLKPLFRPVLVFHGTFRVVRVKLLRLITVVVVTLLVLLTTILLMLLIFRRVTLIVSFVVKLLRVVVRVVQILFNR